MCGVHLSSYRTVLCDVWFFQGIVHALRDYQQKLIDGKISIFVRRAGPNYQEGLRIMRELGMSMLICVSNAALQGESVLDYETW